MFSSKLRSWMDAVRSRKKQHRKEKQTKCNNALLGNKNVVKWDTSTNNCNKDYRDNDRKDVGNHYVRPDNQSGTSGVSSAAHSRYSANNLSSPESAYSTGYSTDGTSPGAPPEGLLNKSKKIGDDGCRNSVLSTIHSPNNSRNSVTFPTKGVQVVQSHFRDHNRSPLPKKREVEESHVISQTTRVIENISGPGLTSPRQRNRIRTNPWVPGGILSPSPVKHEINQSAVAVKHVKDNPRPGKFLSPLVNRRRSISSSSCSSLSGLSVQLEVPRPRSASDEDCTLNEMMGKYDESYVYEKETDILSDSDPTDCETDIDTGQDGGDEDDLQEGELDFIDNCSYLEFEAKTDYNTGNCSYYSYDMQRKKSSRRRATRRSNKGSEKKRRSCSSKKRHAKQLEREKYIRIYSDGSKSAGATPLSVRKATSRPVSKLALEDCLRRRSNSVSFYGDPIASIDKRDKEADLKYRELITEAEQILRAMKTNGLSPRRVPGPTNKRVELLRSTEYAKSETFVKARAPIVEDNAVNNVFCSKIPSNNSYNCPRFSPKKNHITKFIISNSPVLVRKDREPSSNVFKSPMCARKSMDEAHQTHKSILHKDKFEGSGLSPKYRRRASRSHKIDSSSDSDSGQDPSRSNCPQSEPVRRKVYFGHRTAGKTVAFNMNSDTFEKKEYTTSSSENLRQQVLLNTIASLKKKLEDQSASLKQVYRSSHNIYI